MATSDPIADFLTRIRNAVAAKHRYVDIDWSKMKERLAGILKDEGFIDRFLVKKEGTIGTLRLILRYGPDRAPVIHKIDRMSRPGRRYYVGSQNTPMVMAGMGISIVSTSKGVMTGRKARKQGVGGEVLCKVW